MKHSKKPILWALVGLLTLGGLCGLSADEDGFKGAKEMKGYPWLPYDLAPIKKESKYILVEAKGLFCPNCAKDVEKEVSGLSSVTKVKVENSTDARETSWVHIWHDGTKGPADWKLKSRIQKAGYKFQKAHRTHVVVAEITGAFSSMCQSVIKEALMGDTYGKRLDDIAVEVSKRGREGLSKIKMRVRPDKEAIIDGKESLTEAQVQNTIRPFALKIHKFYISKKLK